MDILTRSEELITATDPDMEGLISFSSIEPCPMCLARIMTFGIQKALSLAPDPDSGMVALQDQLPPVWQEIAKERIMRVLKLNYSS